MSSEGAAGASAAARRRGAASRQATLQARAPEGDILARLTADDPSTARQPERAEKERPGRFTRAKAAEPEYGPTAANSPALA